MNEPFWAAWERAMARERRRRRARVAVGWFALLITAVIFAVGFWALVTLTIAIFG